MTRLAINAEHVWKEYYIRHHFDGNDASLKQLLNTPFNRIAQKIRNSSEHVTRETFWALKDVSFQIEHGESVGIIGRNGAGKSTLLKILSRITRPTRGKITLYERCNSLLEIGTGFNPELSGRENIFLNGSFLGMKYEEIRRKFDEIVAFSEIEKFIDTPVKYYSSGMYVRLAFSVAVHLTPELLMLDEVLAVGDAAFRLKSTEKMKQILSSGATILLVSHNDATIKEVCQRAMYIEDGSLVMDGPAAEVVDAYMSKI